MGYIKLYGTSTIYTLHSNTDTHTHTHTCNLRTCTSTTHHVFSQDAHRSFTTSKNTEKVKSAAGAGWLDTPSDNKSTHADEGEAGDEGGGTSKVI